ncbi:MAG: zinc ribbon domain-containing protein [Lutibacter sp.]|uniref:double zinc ribbon domain-containing protein n=1 Tax=Lutibacter sp. TaxID=1925666 RepID=UPI00385F29FE
MKAISCPNCGNKLNEGALFCGTCGQKVIQPSKEIKAKANLCPKCNTPFEKDEKFCAECGTPINESTQKNVPIKQKKQVQKSTPLPISKQKSNSTTKRKKGSILKTLGKIVVGFIAFVIVGSIILYNLDDDWEDTTNSQDSQDSQEEIVDSPNDAINNTTKRDKVIDSKDKNSAEQYRYGIAVQPNQYKAFELYKKLADKGDLNAMVQLSDYYEQGIWTKKDIKKAKKLLIQAADKGSLAAKWQLEFLESEK